ncbi:MAG: hypothetical protein WCO56_18055 [Verrucomicrobiota bacterium]
MKMKITNVILLLLGIGLGIGIHVVFADYKNGPPKDNRRAGTIDFVNANVAEVLEVYGLLLESELILDSRLMRGARNQYIGRRITVNPGQPIPREQIINLIEKALLEQAGVVTTHLDNKRVSVTCNDALPIVSRAPPKKTKPPSAVRTN